MRCVLGHCERMAGRCLVEVFRYAVDMGPNSGHGLVGKQTQWLVVMPCAAFLDAAYVGDAYVHGTLVEGSSCQCHHHHHQPRRPFLKSLQVLYAHVGFHTIYMRQFCFVNASRRIGCYIHRYIYPGCHSYLQNCIRTASYCCRILSRRYPRSIARIIHELS